jgi:nucleoside-diphosphate-sugar epimerase
MRIAITGSSGFIGTKLIVELNSSLHDIIKLDLSDGYDFSQWETIKNIPSFDVMVHLAAMSFVPHSYEKPREFYNTNVMGVVNGLELCRIHGAKFIFTSSYVYGKPFQLPIDETHALDGFNPYSETKIIGEKICKDYHKYFNIPVVILRPFNIYGEGQSDSFLMPLILKQAKVGEINLLDPRPKRDFIHVNDVVRAFIMAIEDTKIQFESFNVGSGISYSVDEVVQMVNSIYNNKLKISYKSIERKNEVLDTVADISKIKDILNWTPKIELIEGLKMFINNNGKS